MKLFSSILILLCASMTHAMEQLPLPVRPQVQPSAPRQVGEYNLPERMPIEVPGHDQVMRYNVDLNLLDQEPLTHKTFNELIETQFDKNEPFILAYALTDFTTSGEPVGHFYDAASLNIHCYGNVAGGSILNNNDPVDNMPIRSVMYYIIKKNEPKFTDAGSQEQLQNINSTFLSLLLSATYQPDVRLKTEAQLALARDYLMRPADQGLLLLKNVVLAKEYFERIVANEDAPEHVRASASVQLAMEYYKAKNYEQARMYAEEAADQDIDQSANATGNALLARIYFLGQGVAPDYAEALLRAHLASNQDINEGAKAIGSSILAQMLYYGIGTRLNYVEARRYAELAANHNVPASDKAIGNELLAKIYLLGQGVIPDYNLAQRYAQLAVNQNVNESAKASGSALLAEIYLARQNEQNYDQARNYAEFAAKQNVNAWAKAYGNALLASIYYYGQGVEHNYSQALHYAQLAANQNVNALAKASGNVLLAEMYLLGQGVEQNNNQATRYAESAANQTQNSVGQILAHTILAEIYYKENLYNKASRITELTLTQFTHITIDAATTMEQAIKAYSKKQYDLARRYAKLAAYQNTNKDAKAYAMALLTQIYYHEKHYDLALLYAQLAAHQDENAFAKANGNAFLAKMYLMGEGVAQNNDQARHYAQLAAGQNVNQSAKEIGLHLLQNSTPEEAETTQEPPTKKFKTGEK